MIGNAEFVDTETPLCSKSHLHYWLNIGRANRTQKLLIMHIFLCIICRWDFVVSVIVINHDSWFPCISLHLWFTPICSTVVLPGANPGHECGSNCAIIYYSIEKAIEDRYLYLCNLGMLFWVRFDSPEPCLCTSLPEEENQVGGTQK